MKNKIKLITTDSYFNIFQILAERLKGKANLLESRNLVFCEEKFSLMAERTICSYLGGSFNTDVFSFGNFLRRKKPIKQVLSKEASAMVVKKIISETELKCFSASKANLAGTLFDLIIQLKSAKVSPSDIKNCLLSVSGVIKNKLEDIYIVYEKYEQFIKSNDFDDQNSILSYLPDIVNEDQDVMDADVYLVGFSSWTEQARNIVLSLLKRAKSVTAILVGGDNNFLYLNETINSFKNLCFKSNISFEEQKIFSDWSQEGRIIKDGIFNPTTLKSTPIQSDKILVCQAQTVYEEIKTVAETIKSKVIEKESRYYDYTIAVPDLSLYKEYIKEVFYSLEIPFFLDEKKKIENHPLIGLILSYIEVFRKNFERQALCSFFKNPLFENDKDFTDKFGDYLIKYNVNYSRINIPFSLGFSSDEENKKFNDFREKIISIFSTFDIHKMLEILNVKEKLKDFSFMLKELREYTEAEVNEQIFDAVIGVINDMEMLLSDAKISLIERKNVFLSGISAMELSIIPQYSDAVFIGGYKETALAKAKNLFCVGLTQDVPSYSDDVAMLSDADINKLEEIKVLVEPKIKIVNDRVKENVGLALASFSEKLFLFYPTSDNSGKKKLKSMIFDYMEKMFKLTPYAYKNGYLTFKQGLESFAKDCGDFAERRISDFSKAVSFYKVVEGDQTISNVLSTANREIAIKLVGGGKKIVKSVSSPTAIEEYYKCPYKAFASRVLKLKDEETDQVNALSVGNLMHEILDAYLKRLNEIDSEEASNKIFNEEAKKILAKDVYARYLLEDQSANVIDRILKEANKYCNKTYRHFASSDFKPKSLEKKINLKINNDVTLFGKIDRIDTFGDYVRVIDYKTGGIDVTDKALFAGLKLQLLVYAAAIMQEEKDKKLAGVYYSPISNKYTAPDKKESFMAQGKSLNDKEALFAQDHSLREIGTSEFIDVSIGKDGFKKTTQADSLNDYLKYALKMIDNAINQIADGVIVSSPYEGSCEYCEYKGLCQREFFEERKISSVDGDIISQALKGDADE